MTSTRIRFSALLALGALAAAPQARAQNVPSHDAYAARVQHCLKVAYETPQDALPLADALLGTPRLPDAPRLGATLCQLQARMVLGQGAQVAAAIEQALPLVDAPGVTDQHRFPALMNLAGMLQSLGRTGEALALLERALDVAGHSGSPAEQMAALQGIALARAIGMDDLAGAEPYFQRALALIDRYQMPPSMAELMLRYNHGYTLLMAGRHAEAEAALSLALDMVPEVPGQEQLRHRILSHHAEILRARGDTGAALAQLDQARAWQRDNRDAQGEAVTLTRLARLHLEQGNPEQALPDAQRALALAEQGAYLAETRIALDLLADVHAALDDPEQVIALIRRALALERISTREVDLERLAALQARADAAAAAQSPSPRASMLRDSAIAGLVLLLLIGAALLLRARRSQRRLARLGATDPLTGLYNRREATRLVEALPASGSAGDTRHALLLVDLDGFKTVNDVHGHAVGDQVLVQVARRLRRACDSRDIIARWGGEEFLVVRPDTSREAAFAFADHLCRTVKRETIDLPGAGALAITVSAGLAPAPFFPCGDMDWHGAIGMADRALYVAKHAGRDGWAGIWGLAAGQQADVHSVRENPEHAQAQGWVVIGGSRPMQWSQLRKPPLQRRSRHGAGHGKQADRVS